MTSSAKIQAFAAGVPEMPHQANWASDPDDMAFGCECADPALQIASWRHEAGDSSQAGAAVS